MKTNLTIALLLIGMMASAQTGTLTIPKDVWNYSRYFSTITYSSGHLESKSDTTILNKGEIKCSHQWVIKKPLLSTKSCAVMHYTASCPDNWPNDFRICKKCFRHENIRVNYTWVEDKDEYEEAFKKLKP